MFDGETFGVKSTLCGPDMDHGTRKSVFCLMQFFQEKKGDMHRFAGTNLSCEFCTIARLDSGQTDESASFSIH